MVRTVRCKQVCSRNARPAFRQQGQPCCRRPCCTQGLHRIEAACLPHNTDSMRLLEGVGFTREGYARAYLKINGVWQDHVLYGLLENDPVRPSLPR